MYATWIVLALVGTVLCYAKAGTLGLIGWSVGIAASTFNLWAMWMAIRFLGDLFSRNPQVRKGGLVLGLAILIKLPVFIAAGMSVQRLGSAASTTFIAAIGLVYSAMVWWASTRS